MTSTRNTALSIGRTRRIVLRDGRIAEWHEFGEIENPQTVALYCHGTPGSGREAQIFDWVAREKKILLIAPDRPGFGGSTLMPHRTVQDWAADAAEILDALQITQCLVLGYSGGTPYALACATAFPQKVSALGLIAPYTPEEGVFALVEERSIPVMMRLQYLLRNNLLLPLSRRLLHIRAKRARAIESFIHSHSHAFEHSFRGAIQDYTAIYGEWGIPPEQARKHFSTVVWVGERDQVISQEGAYAQGQELNATVRSFPGRGHASLFTQHAEEILTEIKHVAYPGILKNSLDRPAP